MELRIVVRQPGSKVYPSYPGEQSGKAFVPSQDHPNARFEYEGRMLA